MRQQEVLIRQFALYIFFLGVIIVDICIFSSIYYLFYIQSKIHIQILFLFAFWYIFLVIKTFSLCYINKKLVNKRIEEEIREEYRRYLAENQGVEEEMDKGCWC